MDDQELRNQLVGMLTVRQAHMDFEDAVADFPLRHINTRPPNTHYSFWHLIEHIRLAQLDILEYIEAESYHWPTFPDDYWPNPNSETDPHGWKQTIQHFYADRNRLCEIVLDETTDLFAPLPNSGERGHTILREINIIASHNAYHTGELGILRQTMGLWGDRK